MTAQKKWNLKNKYIIIGCLILVLLSAIGISYNFAVQKNGAADGCTISIVRDGEVIRTFSQEEMETLPVREVYADLASSQHEDAKGSYKGVELKELLKQADPDLMKECDVFLCTAGDGYTSALSKKDFNKKEPVLVTWEKDGKALAPFTQGGEGPLRLVIASDTYGNRSTKYLTRIICKN